MDRSKYNAALDAYRAELIIEPEVLAASSIMDINVNEEKIIPYIIEAQQLRLEPLIGSKLYRKLKDGTGTFEYTKLLDDYVKPCLIHWALAAYYQVGGNTVANGGMYKHLPTDGDPLSRSDVNSMVKDSEYKAKTYADRLLDFLCTYNTTYPEYEESVGDGIKRNRFQKFAGGLQLEMGEGYRGAPDKDESIFVADFHWGNSDEVAMGFDPTTLSNQSNQVESSVTAQPINNYFWVVSDVEVKIQQLGIDIPMGSFADADQLTQIYVKGEDSGLFWIRIAIADTYESPVTFQIKQV